MSHTSSQRVASRWLHARIQPVPRNVLRSVQILVRRVDAVVKLCQAAVNHDEDLFEWIRSSTNYNFDLDDVKFLIKPLRELHESLRGRALYLEQDGDDPEVWKSIVSAMESTLRVRAVPDLVPRLTRLSSDIRNNMQALRDLQADYRVSDRHASLVYDLAEPLASLARLLSDAAGKFTELDSRRFAPRDERGDRLAPSSADIETLYHVSTSARALKSQGFDRNWHESGGLGGAQVEDNAGNPAISFTSDIHIARELLRAFREAILIAQGEVDAADVIEMARIDGVEAVVRREAESIRNLNSPAGAFELFEYYLGRSRKRYNPVFYGMPEALVARFRGKNPRDVGILVCQVNMRHPGIAYIPAEEEYRVAAEAVVSIDRVIG